MIDSQSVKAPQGKTRGYDAGKTTVGRKRHIAVDTDGRLLMVHLTPADIRDSAGAQAILDGISKRWPWVKHLFADGAYDGLELMTKPLTSTSSSRSFGDPTTRRASRSCPAAGPSNAPSNR